MSKPLIGITTYVEPASWGHWNVEAALVPYEYVRAVERAGGRAVLVPPDEDGIEEVLDALDGLIFSGGYEMTPEEHGSEEHRETLGEFSEHTVRVDPSSRIGEVAGAVKSHHHQGIGRIGAGLRDVAWAEDGTVEAIEDPEKPFVVGVLWHPEAGEDQRLFERLVEAARK